MDVTTLALAKKNAKQYTDSVIAGLGKGIVYKGAVNYYNDLPNNASLGDCYSVLYKGTSGSESSGAEYVWGNKVESENPEWIKLGGEDIQPTQYKIMPEATFENKDQVIQYIGETVQDCVPLTETQATEGFTSFFAPAKIVCDEIPPNFFTTFSNSQGYIEVRCTDYSGYAILQIYVMFPGQTSKSIKYYNYNNDGVTYEAENDSGLCTWQNPMRLSGGSYNKYIGLLLSQGTGEVIFNSNYFYKNNHNLYYHNLTQEEAINGIDNFILPYRVNFGESLPLNLDVIISQENIGWVEARTYQFSGEANIAISIIDQVKNSRIDAVYIYQGTYHGDNVYRLNYDSFNARGPYTFSGNLYLTNQWQDFIAPLLMQKTEAYEWEQVDVQPSS